MINIFESYADAGQQLPQREKEQYYSALIEFIAYGMEPNLKGAAQAVFTAIRPSLELSKKRSESGKKGGRKKQSSADFASKQTESKLEANEEAKAELASAIYTTTSTNTNTSKEEGVQGEGKTTRFSKPQVSEIAEYASSLGYSGFDAQRFHDYFAAQGWKLSNGNAMKDWKAAVRNWNSRSQGGTQTRRGVSADAKYAKYR